MLQTGVAEFLPGTIDLHNFSPVESMEGYYTVNFTINHVISSSGEIHIDIHPTLSPFRRCTVAGTN